MESKVKTPPDPVENVFLHGTSQKTDLILPFCSTNIFVRLRKVKTSLCSIKTSPRRNDDCNQIWSNFS